MTTTLSELEIVALDCQTTGANPTRGHILELGWVRTRASSNNIIGDTDVQVFPMRLPAEAASRQFQTVFDESPDSRF